MLNSAQRINDLSRPSDDAIEALIHHATSSRQDVKPLRDTRTQLFVGNLPYRVRWQDLKDLFRKAGTVLRADVSLGPDNRSRGYGTVLLATAEDAGRAVDMFNGYTWQTRVLEVRLDRLMPEYEHRAGMGSGTGLAMGSTAGGPGSGGGVSGPHSTASGPYLGLGVGGSISGATSPAHSGLGSGFMALATRSDLGPSTNLSLPAGVNPVASPNPFLQSFSPRPSSSSAALQDPLDFLHPSISAPGPAEFQSTDPNANRTLFVGNLPFHIQWQDLKDLFRQAGTILRADVALGPDNRSRGFGTVVFATEADAENAIKMFNGYEHNGRVLNVHYDNSPSALSLSSSSRPLTSTFLSQTSSSGSRHSSTSSTAAHSAATSPLPGHAVQPTSVHSRHEQTNQDGNEGYGLNPRFDIPHPQALGSAQYRGYIALPPGFLYDYGPPSMPTSPHESYQRQQQEKGYFERPALQQQAERDRIRQDGQTKGSIERVGLLQQQRVLEWNRDSESHIRRPLAQTPATASSILDIETLATSLASMKYSPSGGRSHSSATVESSLSPTSISASISVSASGSTPNSYSNPTSIPLSTAPSKPPSTKPFLGAPQNLHSVSSSSLPAHFDIEELNLGSGLHAAGGTVSAGGSRKGSFTSSAGTESSAYDRQYQLPHLYAPSISTRTSTSSTTTTTTESSAMFDAGLTALSVTEDELIGYRSLVMRQGLAQVSGSEEKNRASSAAPSETGSGRLSRFSRAESVGGSRSSSRGSRQERQGSLPSQDHSQSPTTLQEGQMQKQHPHHPGPIALPPPPAMSFNPMQMPMVMPLTTMTPGHSHGHALTPHAFPMMNMNMSPLYHPAHHVSPTLAAMAAAAMHGGGSPSPFAMYPGPPAIAGTMVPLTPHGLPPITPSMPPFTFFPQQYYGSVGVKGTEGHDREGGRDSEGVGDRPQQMPRSQPLRLNLNTVPGGFSPGVAMSPGTFYGKPGQVPNPYINAAVGAPVHPVAPHLAQSPLQHPYQPSYAAGVPHGYTYSIPSPRQGDLPGGEPQGYFDHVYIPGVLGKAGGDGTKVGGSGQSVGQGPSGGAGSDEKSSYKKGAEISTQEDVTSPLLGDEDNHPPSRTRSVGHTHPSSAPGRGKIHRSGSDPVSGPGTRESEKDASAAENNPKSQISLV